MRSGLAIVPLSLFGVPPLSVTLVVSCVFVFVSPWVPLLVSVCALAGALKFHCVIVSLLLFFETHLLYSPDPMALCVLSQKDIICKLFKHLCVFVVARAGKIKSFVCLAVVVS